MSAKAYSYSLFGRSAWFALAILLVVFCGPVKKLIEVKYAHKTLTNLPPSADNNKLKTYYREKHEVASYVNHVVAQTPANDFAVFLACAVLIFVLLPYSRSFGVQRHSTINLSPIPLYLRIRKLQV